MGHASTKSTRSPAFQFYPRDFLSSSKVDQMSMAERGVYITLLSRCWLDDGLPTDINELAGLARMKPAQFERVWHGQVGRCFHERGGRFYNPRLERERKVQADYRKKQKDNADKGWQSRRNATALPSPNESHQSGNALHLRSASASATASAGTEERPPAARTTPIQSPRRKDAAWEGPRVYVPQRAHSDFLAIRGGGESALAELLAFYEAVSNEWTDGARRGDEPGSDMFRFWKARYDERWPSAAAPRRDTRPQWVQDAERAAKGAK